MASGEEITHESVIQSINRQIQLVKPLSGQVSDGYHTFEELYEQRTVMFAIIGKMISHNVSDKSVWRSLVHSDGTSYPGYFIAGLFTEPGKQITYHVPIVYWSVFSYFEERGKAPEFDGHTSEEALQRLTRLLEW